MVRTPEFVRRKLDSIDITLMKIAQIIDSLKVGGAQKLQITFAEVAKRRGLEVLVISLQEHLDSPFLTELRNMNVEVFTLTAGKVLSARRLLRIREILRSRHIDLVHSHLTAANIAGIVAARITGLPAVATLHTAGIDPRFHTSVRRGMETLLLRYSDARVVGVGKAVAEANKERLGGKQIEVINNAVTSIPVLEPAERMKVRAEISGDPARPLLITVGRLSPPKGYPDLLDAMVLLRERCPDAVLAIVGGGVMQEELENKISASGLEGRVFLLGERSDVARLLAAADVYVCSSRWEGLPVSVLEAMAAGLPVVSTAVGSIPDVVTSTTGALVPTAQPADLAHAIATLLLDPRRMEHMGNAARAHVSNTYGPEAWMDRWINLYSDLCHRPTRARRVA